MLILPKYKKSEQQEKAVCQSINWSFNFITTMTDSLVNFTSSFERNSLVHLKVAVAELQQLSWSSLSCHFCNGARINSMFLCSLLRKLVVLEKHTRSSNFPLVHWVALEASRELTTSLPHPQLQLMTLPIYLSAAVATAGGCGLSHEWVYTTSLRYSLICIWASCLWSVNSQRDLFWFWVSLALSSPTC